MKPFNSHQKLLTNKTPSLNQQPSEKKRIKQSDIEKLINVFQTSKTKFSQFIEHHLSKNTSSKRILEDENHHKNEQFND